MFDLIDFYFFHIFNVQISNSIFDVIMPIITSVKYWIPIYIAGGIYLIYKYKKQGLIMLLFLMCALASTDNLNHRVIKEAVGRERPCRQNIQINKLIGCPGGKSFPSSHALNNFCIAFLLSQFFRKYKYWFYGTAAVIAFSRVYCGVHFPLDIISGAIFGLLFGYLFYKLYLLLAYKLKFKESV